MCIYSPFCFCCVCGCSHFTWLGWLRPHTISLLHKFVLVVSLLRAFTPHFAFAMCVAARILPGLADYDPIQFHCCINLSWLCHCCVHLLPILLLLCVWLLAFYLALLFTPHVALAVCMAACILPGLVDYDPMQFHCCINLYLLYHRCVHLLPILLLLCVWLFAFYLAWLIMTPCNFIAA